MCSWNWGKSETVRMEFLTLHFTKNLNSWTATSETSSNIIVYFLRSMYLRMQWEIILQTESIWSYEIISENYFCVRHKNRRKQNQHFKLLFFKLNSHLGPSNHIPTCTKIKFASHKQHLFGRLFNYKSKEDSKYRPKYTSSFFTLSDSTRLTNLKK